MKTLTLASFIGILLVTALSFVSFSKKKDYIKPVPLPLIENTSESKSGSANLGPDTYFSFTINANGTLYWYMDNE